MTIPVTVNDIEEKVRQSLRHLIEDGDFFNFSELDANAQQELIGNICNGALDFISETFPKVSAEVNENPQSGTYPLRIGKSYFYMLKKSSWAIFEHSVALAASFSAVLSGSPAIGALGTIVSIRNLVKTVLSHLIKLDESNRKIVGFVLEYYVKEKAFPKRADIVDALCTIEDAHSIKRLVQDLLTKGVLKIIDKETDQIGLEI